MPSRRPLVPLVVSLASVFVGAGCLVLVNEPGPTYQRVVHLVGFAEPHTPGSGDALELPASPPLTTLLGSSIDLNTISVVRTAFKGALAPPKVILILVPGFLGGATTFDPIARDLVEDFAGDLEVWAIDRRPNQLEDRVGAIHAAERAAQGDFDAIVEGVQYYFADTDQGTIGVFPDPLDLDVDQDGELDPQLPLEDEFGVLRTPVIFSQDDLRFMAHWGLDTYFRDWKILVDTARFWVGADGLVLLGGHSQGTTWATSFAAYDFDTGPGVDPGHAHVDGLLLLEGGGVGTGSSVVGLSTGDVPRPTSAADYLAIVDQLEAPGGPDVFLEDFSGIDLRQLGPSGETAAVAGFHQPTEASIIQRTPIFGAGLTGLLLSTPATNRAVVGLFLDDDFSAVAAFSASFGFTDNGPNQNFFGLGFYRALDAFDGGLRTWKDFDDPTLPSIFDVPPCDPAGSTAADPNGVGCAIVDNGPPFGVEREVSDVDDFLKTQFGKSNGFEWYFAAGRVTLDFSFGNDSSVLGDDSLLAVTQNASVSVPVLAIGGSNGLTPTASSFDPYLDSIATPPADRTVTIVEGYAHLDVISAFDNEAVPPIVDWIDDLLAP